uniref:Uncharacterized protein n=1 Tax=Amphimedon queenslandica TaxID=400682 RepID=A0A1X7UGW6_AMPQE
MEEKEAGAVIDSAVATVAVASVLSTLMPGSGPSKRRKKSYTRVEKLKVVTIYHENLENMLNLQEVLTEQPNSLTLGD